MDIDVSVNNFAYKNKSFISKIITVLTTILYVVLSWHNILNVIISIKSVIVEHSIARRGFEALESNRLSA